MRTLILATLMILSITAQDPGTITGAVKEAGTGVPIADYLVAISRDVKTRTDSQGRYTLRGVPPGTHRIHAACPKHEHGDISKVVTLAAGQNLTSIDFAPHGFGRISGRVLDENREPVPGMMVLAMARQYQLGASRYVYAKLAKTDDQGAYHLSVPFPGLSLLLVAQSWPSKVAAISDAPAEPKLRRKVYAPTYYPGSTAIDGAQRVIVRGEEHREGVDITVAKRPSYCVEGVAETENGPAALVFTINPEPPNHGSWLGGGIFFLTTHGLTGPDGKLRVCGLAPGDYQVTFTRKLEDETESDRLFTSAAISIADGDVRNLRCQTSWRLSVPIEVSWDGAPPKDPVVSKLSFRLWSMTGHSASHVASPVESSIPGETLYRGIFPDEYSIQVTGLPKDLYVKDITYAGSSVLRSPLRVGSAIGEAKLRIVLARDGAVINARVADKDGNPVPDSCVLIFPAEATTEAELAAALVIGQTDQKGVHTTNALAPGKYLVLASTTSVDMSPESIGKLYRARTHAQEVSLAPNATVAVTLLPN